ncbi:hypothetical protein LCGC14_1411050 [marine sediment metagenome]|uniref:Uncharacterized protein n=1 Tax=marine sediment metagenome TaxID=412755 RepID=A0A0F9KFC6_9ZZZZ
MKTTSLEFCDAALRAQLQQALIAKVEILPARKLKAIKFYIHVIRQLSDGWLSDGKA